MNSKTTLKELNARYRAVLKKCAFLNAVAMGMLIAMPAVADNIIENKVFSDYLGSDSAIASNFVGALTVKNTTFSDNNSTLLGGAISSLTSSGLVSVIDSNFTNNIGELGGGAIAVFEDLTVINSTFAGNKVTYIPYNQEVASDAVDGGGAIFAGSEVNLQVKDSIFTGNSSSSYGGAIATRENRFGNQKDGYLDIQNSVFKDNSADLEGGAIYNSFWQSQTDATGSYIANSEFINNSSKTNGGAIYNSEEIDKGGMTASLIVADSLFEDNKATNNGGAIYNEANLTFAGTNTFIGNTSDVYGGAIYTKGAKNPGETTELTQGDIALTDAIFKENKAVLGGGIFASMSADVNVTGGSFENNTALGGGAIYRGVTRNSDSFDRGELNINGTLFKNNIATGSGGAVGNFGESVIENAIFESNQAQGITEVDSGKTYVESGGAIFLGSEADTIIKNTAFNNNSATRDSGGAIGIRNFHVGNNANGSLIITDSTFTKNTAAINGGAFDNYFYSSQGDGIEATIDDSVTISGSTFTQNTAKNGGAIYNHGESDLQQATIQVGRITLTDATFDGNTATDKGGAIYNDVGALITFDGTNTFKTATDTIFNAGDMVVNGDLITYADIESTGSLTFNSGSTYSFDLGKVITGDVTLNDTIDLKPIISLDVNDGEYQFIDGTVTADSWNLITDNNLYDIVLNDDDISLSIALKSAEEIASNTGADLDTTEVLTNVTAGSSNGANAEFDALAADVKKSLQSSNPDEVKKAVETAQKMSTDTTASAQSTTVANTTKVMTVASARFDTIKAPNAIKGHNAGDATTSNGAMWAQGLVNTATLNGSNGFNSDSTGLALGLESNMSDAVKIGVGYAYTNTDITTDSRLTDVDSYTGLIYGQYKPNNFHVNGILSYTMADYDENAGVKTATYDVNSLGLQAMTGYDMVYDKTVVTPEMGLRYMRVNQKSYTDSIGSTVASTKSDILTAVVGAKVSADIETYQGNLITPEISIAGTYDMLTDDASSLVTLANGSIYKSTGDALDRFGIETGVALKTTVADKIDLSIGYEGKFRKSYQDHSGVLNIKYNF